MSIYTCPIHEDVDLFFDGYGERASGTEKMEHTYSDEEIAQCRKCVAENRRITWYSRKDCKKK
jgi:hypothetical protein